MRLREICLHAYRVNLERESMEVADFCQAVRQVVSCFDHQRTFLDPLIIDQMSSKIGYAQIFALFIVLVQRVEQRDHVLAFHQ